MGKNRQRNRNRSSKPAQPAVLREIASTTAAAAAAMVVFGSGEVALALPQGMRVRGGQLSIEQRNGSTTLIKQGSRRAAADFKGFDIGTKERVQIRQPNAKSVFMGRVTSGQITEIHGQLDANGRVLLINPAGVVVGPTGTVNTAAFTATTLHADPEQFMQGGTVELKALPGADPNAAVINQGAINTADGGFAALVAPHVVNDGVINARLGQVQLASGTAATLDISGDGLIQVVLDPAVAGSISNSGSIQASHVRLGGGDAAALTAATVNLGGVIEARSAAEVRGLNPAASEAASIEVRTAGAITLSGRVDASARKAGFSGGSVKLLGSSITLNPGAVVEASGPAGGGEVLVGGNYLGQGPEPNAKQVTIAPGAAIRADATQAGDGGRVIVWSDERTEFHGEISAKGGPEGGDGGFVETSSKQTLVVTGTVSTAAPKGKAGQWLLDPEDVAIVDDSAEAEAEAETETETEAEAESDAAEEDTSSEDTTAEAESTDSTETSDSADSADSDDDEEEEEEETTTAEAESSSEETDSTAEASDTSESTAESSESSISSSSIEQARAEGTEVTVVSSGEVSGAESEEATAEKGGLTVISNAEDPAAAVAAAKASEPSQPTPDAKPQPEAASTETAATPTAPAPEPAPAPTPTNTPELYTLYLNGADLNLSAQQEQLSGRNVVIASCEGSCSSDRAGNIFIDSLTGLASLQVLAAADVTLEKEISVSGALSIAGALTFSGTEIHLTANELVLAGPVQVAEAIKASGGPALTISSASSDRAIQLGGADQASVNLDAPAAVLQLGSSTLNKLNQAGLAELNIGGAEHTGGINLDASASLSASKAVTLQSQQVSVAGAITAGDGNRGGQITISGDQLSVQSTARIDASGPMGGGQVLIGGSWQNENPAVRQAINTTIAKGAVIDASATRQGTGGTIVAWSDITNPLSRTTVAGTLRAEGGALDGDGGRIETSGYDLKVEALRFPLRRHRATPANGCWIHATSRSAAGRTRASIPASLPQRIAPSSVWRRCKARSTARTSRCSPAARERRPAQSP